MVKNLLIAVLACALLVSLAFHLSGRAPLSTGEDSPAPHSDEEGEESVSEESAADEVQSPYAALAALLQATESDPRFAGAAIGFCLLDAEGETLVDYHARTALIPASSLKTLTTATALEVLGPDFRFETRLGTSAPEDPANPQADLILLGGGDPTLSLSDLEDWAKALAEAGVRTIPGRVIGDGRAFPGSPFADFWNWGDIGNGYGSPVSGLNLEHNRFTAVFAPGEAEGEAAKFLGAFPPIPEVSWWNETYTAAAGSGDGIVLHGGERAAVIHLRGTVPLGEELEVVGAVPDPERFAAYALKEALLAAGVQVTGEALGAGQLFLNDEPIPSIAKELIRHQSPPLIDIVRTIHEHSDNHETECVHRLLGLRSGLEPVEAIRRHWRQRGLELVGLRMVDGSGLARADHIPPDTLARLQHHAAKGPHGEAYLDSLPSTGGGRIRYKAGAMSSIRSYAGVVDTLQGRLSFALIVNHYPEIAAVRDLQVALFQALLESSTPEDETPPAPSTPTTPKTIHEAGQAPQESEDSSGDRSQ